MNVSMTMVGFISVLSLFVGSFCFGSGPQEKDLFRPGGLWWRPKSRIVVNKKLTLVRPTSLEADEIEIGATIVTEGQPFRIFARRLVFAEGGKIVAFEGPAVGTRPHVLDLVFDMKVLSPLFAVARGPLDPIPGDKGPDGKTGAPGGDGADGLGADDLFPGEIGIFAGEVVGEVKIDGKGQDGAPGGPGLDGGNGGVGEPGSPAIKNAWFFLPRAGGKGGTGGDYGKGGRGGDGGRGGIPVPVRYSVAWDYSSVPTNVRLESAPGTGGAPGLAGLPGQPGGGGPGGAGIHEEKKLLFITLSSTHAPGGDPGDPGAACPYPIGRPLDERTKKECTFGDGTKGADGVVPPSEIVRSSGLARNELTAVQTFKRFEKARYRLAIKWLDFHWWRSFAQILEASMQLLVDRDCSNPRTVGSVLSGWLLPDQLRLIEEKWSEIFLAKVRDSMERVRPESEAHRRLEEIVTLAERYRQVLIELKRHALFPKVAKAEIRSILDETNRITKRSLRFASAECERYANSVLDSAEYATFLKGQQNYYEFPACEHTGVSALTQPIELTRDIEVNIDPKLRDSVAYQTSATVEPDAGPVSIDPVPKAFAPAPDDEARYRAITLEAMTPEKIRIFYPRLNRAVGWNDGEIHKGYVLAPRRTMDLGTFSADIRVLSTVVIGAEGGYGDR